MPDAGEKTGPGSDAAGTLASRAATCSRKATRPTTGRATRRPASGAADSGARSSPAPIIAGRTGSTAALASGATGDTTLKLVDMKGSVPTWAAQVTAKGSLAQPGI